MLRRSFSLGCCLLLGLVALPCPAMAEGWKAGAAKQKITPPEPMWMAGYGSRNHASTGFLNDLWAKALVLEDAKGARVAIVTLDLVGIGRDLADPICDQLQKKFDLNRSNVALCCSHTHSGPVVGRNLRTLHYDLVDARQQKLIDRYAEHLREMIVDVVGRAIDALAPSQISWGQGTATFAVNRRNNKEPDVPRLRAEGQLAGPVDHDVPVLKVTDLGRKTTALLIGYACHATVLDGYDWSSDYPGFAQSELEQQNPGCTALFFAGCGADQNPLPRRRVELARQYGHDLAAAVGAALKSQMKPLAGNLAAGFTEIPLDLAKVPTKEEIEQDTKSADRYVAARARLYHDRLSAGQTVPATYSYPVQVWRLGSELVLVTLGGEVVVDYALRIKQDMGPANTWVAGYANDVMAYIPSRRVLTEGGYEGGGAMVYYSLPSPWAPTIEKTILDAVRTTTPPVR
ncbi:MAG: neutral/alkaline non-lysosomal ceramidase N-terminal domain-containing protein [Planctomycetia bacterium]|nr:neutral/alkaline non-lysosomal ceramidase N-terminal domain-containing protein [Planctomycetia bacterium]